MTMIKIKFLFLSSILKTRLDEVYPNVFIALRTMLNCPDTAASTERSCSKLKLIKNFNRSHMTDSRITSLAMLSIEASCVFCLDLDGVIKAFACQKVHSKPIRYHNNMTLFTIVSWLLFCYIFRMCYTATQPSLS